MPRPQPERVDSSLFTVLLPVALGVVMFGLGLGLTVGDFRRVAGYPRPVLVALACQVLLLPLLCFGLVVAFGLEPALAVGMMLLAASPGGTTANLYSHLFGGDVALNVTLTAINSVIAVVTLPLIVNLSMAYFFADSAGLGLRFDKTVQVFALVLIPVGLGMLVRSRAAGFAERCRRPVKVASVLILVGVIAAAIGQERDDIGGYLADVGLIALLFSVVSLSVGYGASRAAGVRHPQAVAACMEIGVHNTTLSLAVALSPALLDNARMAVPSAVYGVLMFFTAAAAGLLLRRIGGREGQTAGTSPPAVTNAADS